MTCKNKVEEYATSKSISLLYVYALEHDLGGRNWVEKWEVFLLRNGQELTDQAE